LEGKRRWNKGKGPKVTLSHFARPGLRIILRHWFYCACRSTNGILSF
jgi:hypothetical protein